MASVADRGQVVLITALLVAVGLLTLGLVVGQLAYGGATTHPPDPIVETQTAVADAVDRTGAAVTPRATPNQTVEAWTEPFDTYTTTIEHQTPGVVTIRRNQTAAAAAAEASDTVTAAGGLLVEDRGDVAVVVEVVVDIEIQRQSYHGTTTERIPTRPRIDSTPTTTVILPASLPRSNGAGLYKV